MSTHQPGSGPGDRRLPVGTVTFLFTDIEGSTRLVTALGAEGWAPLLERHRAILRDAIAAQGGVEVQTEGDAVFAVFARAPAAIAAAAEAQRGLAAEPWPEAAPIRVRMGLHTGEGLLDADGSYVGADVHRAARIAAAAHGGQLLLSDTVRALVETALPAGVSLIDLGEHRLKDLRPQRLGQARIDGLPSAFPALKSLDARPNNLPTQLTSFVGREHELDEAARLLARTRLLTLSGPGGTGKTRLSLQLAATVSDDFPDGLWFVALEPIRDASLVAPAIARTLSLAINSNRPTLDLVAERIGSQKVLMILDNFEQVVTAAPVVADLLRACPELRMVVTSRAALHVSGEQEYQVPGLPTPPDISRLSLLERENLPAAIRNPAVEALSQYEAVRLFIARACAVRPDFAVTNENAPAVAQISARLQGMPLAIELAAVRVKLLTPAQILARLEHQLNLLTSGARDLAPRQQTLRGAIAWSYELLDPAAQRLLAHLSVFAGGFDLAAAEAVCGEAGEIDILDGITSLVDQSLLRRQETESEARFEMFPTIQEFAAEKLAERGDEDLVTSRHAAHYLGFAEHAAARLSGADQRLWLDRLERDHDNIRAVLVRAGGKPDAETAARLGFAMWRFWQKRGYLFEARGRLEAIAREGSTLPERIEAQLCEALGGVAYWQADHPAAVRWYDAALAIWRRLGDKAELANALYNRSFADILPIMLEPEKWTGAQGETKAAAILAMCDEALGLFREAGNRFGEGNILWATGGIHYFLGQAAEAERLYRQALPVFRALGERTMEAWAEHMLSMALLRLDRTAEAGDCARAALHQFHEAGDLAGVAMVFDDLSSVAVATGDLPRAGRLHGAARQLQSATGADLAAFVETLFASRTRATARTVLPPADLDRFAGEGAALSLDQAVAYALENLLPTATG